ncbi:hypothetical protein GF358_04375 [Candidatus Woesearchaeota archaeon]|nr:hypothetical protein [Candidatus Woesearchaeota archaeon]
MYQELIYLLIGLFGLWLGAELVLRGAMNIAKKLKISHMFIGLTILAIGTDLPELFIDITAAIQRLQGIETSGLIIGETIGTCMGQIALALGILSLMGIDTVKKRELLRDGLVMLMSVGVLFLAGLDGEISIIDGGIFVLIYLFYFITITRDEQVFRKIKKNHAGNKIIWAIVSLISGFVFLIYASKAVVTNAVILASLWGISQAAVGVIIVGLGTSLPEISVALTALFKKTPELSIGNLLGSNIFDILFTVGISSVISGFLVSKNLLYFDIPILFATSLIVLYFLKTKMRLSKKEAIILIGIYFAYIIFRLVFALN